MARKRYDVTARDATTTLHMHACTQALTEFNRRQALKIAARGGEDTKTFVAPAWVANTKGATTIVCLKPINQPIK